MTKPTNFDGCLFGADQMGEMKAARADYEARLAADRVSAEWRGKAARKPSDLSDTPLFGGKRQRPLVPQGDDDDQE